MPLARSQRKPAMVFFVPGSTMTRVEKLAWIGGPAQFDARIRPPGLTIGEVRQMREAHPGHHIARSANAVVARQAIFFLRLKVGSKGQGAKHGKAGCVRLQPVLRVREQRHIPAKPIDDGAQTACPISRREQRPDTRELREDATAVDIAHEQPPTIDMTARPHIDQIAPVQVQLHGAAGAFHQQDVAAVTPGVENFRDRLPEFVEVPVIVYRRVMTSSLAQHDQL